MKTAMVILLLFCSGPVLADVATRTAAKEVSCGWLMTDTECVHHRQTLRELTDPVARLAYLEGYMAMMREREAMCGCVAERQVMARAQYR